MVKCNNNYVCEDDAVTYDEITDESKCVAVADDVCTTCDTVLGTRNSIPKKGKSTRCTNQKWTGYAGISSRKILGDME